MKKALSVLLIAAALFGFYGGAVNLNDVLACKDYWEEEGEKSTADMNKLEDGLNQLKDNEQAYLDGLDQVADGEEALAQGEADYAAGQAELAQGEADYAAAPGKLADAKKKIAKGEDDLAEGQAKLDAGYAEYATGEKQLDGLSELIKGWTKIYKGYNDGLDGTPAWKVGYKKLKDGRDASAKKFTAGKETLTALAAFLNDDTDPAAYMNTLDVLCSKSSKESEKGYSMADFDKAMLNMEKYIDEITANVNAKKQALNAGYSTLSGGVGVIESNLNTYKNNATVANLQAAAAVKAALPKYEQAKKDAQDESKTPEERQKAQQDAQTYGKIVKDNEEAAGKAEAAVKAWGTITNTNTKLGSYGALVQVVNGIASNEDLPEAAKLLATNPKLNPSTFAGNLNDIKSNKSTYLAATAISAVDSDGNPNTSLFTDTAANAEKVQKGLDAVKAVLTGGSGSNLQSAVAIINGIAESVNSTEEGGLAYTKASLTNEEQGEPAFAAGMKALDSGQTTIAAGIRDLIAGMLTNKDMKEALKNEGAKVGLPMSAIQLFASDQSPLFTDSYPEFAKKMTVLSPVIKDKILPLLRQTKADGVAKLKDADKQLAKGEKDLAAGKKKLAAGKKAYAKGLADYAAAPGKLAAGRAALAEGLQKLMDGRADLAAGKDKLAEYEDGEQQVRDGLATLMGTEANGGLTSIADRRSGDDDFDNGDKHLELDEGLDAVDVGRGYQADSGELITKEITGRAVGTAAGLGAAALAVLAGLLSLLKKNKGAGVSAILSAVAGGAGIAYGTSNGMEFSNIAGSTVGSLPWIAFGVLAAVAAVHAIAHFASKEA